MKLISTNKCELVRSNEKIYQLEVKINEILSEKKAVIEKHERECIELNAKISMLMAEVTLSSNRAQKAEENVDLSKAVTTLIEERALESKTREKLTEVSGLQLQ